MTRTCGSTPPDRSAAEYAVYLRYGGKDQRLDDGLEVRYLAVGQDAELEDWKALDIDAPHRRFFHTARKRDAADPTLDGSFSLGHVDAKGEVGEHQGEVLRRYRLDLFDPLDARYRVLYGLRNV